MDKEDKQIIDRAVKEEWRIGDRTRLKHLLEKNLKQYRENVELENKIADLKANFDYALEGKDLEIKELKISDEYIIKTLESKVEKLEEDLRNKRISIKNKKAEIKDLEWQLQEVVKDNDNYQAENKSLEQQIEKMKCCGNCKFGYCGWSSQSIDKDGNRTCHAWNEEKLKYCDIGKNGKYQCWEIKE